MNMKKPDEVESRYIMAGNHDEAKRMEENHPAAQTRRWLKAAGVKLGMRVLTIGSRTTPELWEVFGITKREVVAVELEQATVDDGNAKAQREWKLKKRKGHCPIRFVLGNVEKPLPFAEGQFDGVVSFRTFEYLGDPAAALANMARVVRPGGLIVVGDIDGYAMMHAGMSAGLHQQLNQLLGAVQKLGRFNPWIGRQLFGLFYGAGLQKIDVRSETYHLTAGAVSAPDRTNWTIKLETLRPVGQKVFGSPEAYDRFMTDMLAFLDDPGTFLYSTFFLVSGRKPL